jgi:hypothetical protein
LNPCYRRERTVALDGTYGIKRFAAGICGLQLNFVPELCVIFYTRGAVCAVWLLMIKAGSLVWTPRFLLGKEKPVAGAPPSFLIPSRQNFFLAKTPHQALKAVQINRLPN